MGAARQPRAIKLETICGLNLICSADGSRVEALRANQHGCIPGRPSWHCTAGGGRGKSAPNVSVQFRLKFTFKPGSLGAALLSLPALFSSKTKAKCAVPSGVLASPKSEAGAPCEWQTLHGTLQLPHECTRKAAGEVTDPSIPAEL